MYHRFTFDKLEWFGKLNHFQRQPDRKLSFLKMYVQTLIYGNPLMTLYITPQHVFPSRLSAIS